VTANGSVICWLASSPVSGSTVSLAGVNVRAWVDLV
jgi:hypothetical protein